MGSSLDLLLAGLCFIVGFLCLVGKGDLFLNKRTMDEWKKTFHIRKVELGYGIAFLLLGIATVINLQFNSTTSSIIYLISIIVIFGASVLYMYFGCKKK